MHAVDPYQHLAELADAADWYHRDQATAAEQLVQLAEQTPTSPLDWWGLCRLRATTSRRAALASYLAAQAETERQLLAQTLPETAPAIEDPEPEEGALTKRAELLSRFHDAINAEGAALAEADREFEEARSARWPWQRTRSELAFLRGRYADACARTHADAAHQARLGIDQFIRSRLPPT